MNNIKSLVVSFMLTLIAVSSFGQSKIKDVRTNPDLYFLRADEVANSLSLLPPPPQQGSILWLNDEAQYQWGKLQRDTPRGDQAAADARVNGDGVPNAFSDAFGVRISKEETPKIYKLVINMREDAGDLATRGRQEPLYACTSLCLLSRDDLQPRTAAGALHQRQPIPLATPLSAGLPLSSSLR